MSFCSPQGVSIFLGLWRQPAAWATPTPASDRKSYLGKWPQPSGYLAALTISNTSGGEEEGHVLTQGHRVGVAGAGLAGGHWDEFIARGTVNGHTHTSSPWHMPLPLPRTRSPRSPRGLQVSAQPLLRGISLITSLSCHSGHIPQFCFLHALTHSVKFLFSTSSSAPAQQDNCEGSDPVTLAKTLVPGLNESSEEG